MKKALKIFGITAGAILGTLLIAICVVVWLIFTPSKLTPIVRDFLPNAITCQTELDTVDLTFFSSFPEFGIRVHNLALINPMDGAQSDTVAAIETCVATVNVREYLKNNAVIINGVYLYNTQANIYVNADSVANYDIFVSSEETETDTTSTSLFDALDVRKVELKNISATYVDVPSKMQASICGIDCETKLKMKGNDIKTELNLATQKVLFSLSDSTKLSAEIGALETSFDGSMSNFDLVDGTLNLYCNGVNATMQGVQYADSLHINTNLPFKASLDSLQIDITNALVSINEHQISLSGEAQALNDISMDVDFSTNNIILNSLLKLVPKPMLQEYLDGIDLDGVVQLSGNVAGVMNDSLMPVIAADATYTAGTISVAGLGHDLYDVEASVHANVDMNNEENSALKINALAAKTGKSMVSATGNISDLLNKMNFDLKANLRVWLLDLKTDLPDDVFASGLAEGVVFVQSTLDDLTNANLKKIKANGNIVISNLDAIYADSTFVSSNSLGVNFNVPSTKSSEGFKELIDVEIKSGALNASMTDFFKTKLQNADMRVGVSDVMDTTKDVALSCEFKLSNVNFDMEADSISANIRNPRGIASMYPKGKNTKYACLFNCDSLYSKVASDVTARTGAISVDADAEYNEKESDVISQWNPNVKLNFNQGQIALSALDAPVKIAKIQCDFNKKRLNIIKSQMIVGNSDFELAGTIRNIAAYLNNEDLLKGNLKFTSNYTDVMELMDMVSGMGDTTTVAETAVVAETAPSVSDQPTAQPAEEANPFMVPLGVDVVLETKIKKALVGNSIIENAGGGVTIRDGVLVIEEMGFTCDAAQMQLTAMYRSERKNHLFAGLDFHLIDISISDLIEMIPDIDTIVPMLKSFSGKAEFHLAAETYLKSDYTPKYSTLRGASAIKGKNLVVMDNETFDMISKKLLFKKKTKNVVDSISVEMTAFRNQVDLYPFVVSMDKYQAIIAGYHNLDMSFNYHISLTKSPLLMKLGLNVLGTLDEMKFKLGRCKYGRLYRPKQRGVVDEQILSLKKTISSSLQAGVKNQEVLLKD